MSSDQAINFQSLNVVRDELIATIEMAARDLEDYINNEQRFTEALNASIAAIQQITGILRMLEFDGAVLLSEELHTVVTGLNPEDSGERFERKMEVVSNTFFILTRYLEYLQQVQYQVPALLIPHINALRKIRGESVLPESHFIRIVIPSQWPPIDTETRSISSDNMLSELRRARHMYLIGLLGLVRERQVSHSLALMRRSMKIFLRLTGREAAISRLWWLAELAMMVMQDQHMSLLETRKFLFMRLEKVIRQTTRVGEKAFAAVPPKGLLKELLYIVALGQQQDDSQALKALFSANKRLILPYSEQALQKEYAALYGPSAHTIEALSKVLLAELGNAKRTLENASQSSSNTIDDLPGFTHVLVNIAEIFGVISLHSASQSLKQKIDIVAGWQGDGDSNRSDEMADVANNLLYLESVIQDLQTPQHDERGLEPSDQHAMDAQIASQELSSAIDIVIEESRAGLSLTKRALSSFSDSKYDNVHIRNLGKTLNSIRGAMALLRYDRVSSILERSVLFVEEVLDEQELPAAINEILDTFADVIIAVEYYLDSVNPRGQMDDSVLSIAEESLVALGFDIEH